MRKSLLLALICALVFSSLTFAQEDNKGKKILKNADVVVLMQDHFDDETLVKIIEASETDFDISGDALIALKNQGVSSVVMRAMLEATKNKRRAAEVPTSPATNPAPKTDSTRLAPSSNTSAPASTPTPAAGLASNSYDTTEAQAESAVATARATENVTRMMRQRGMDPQRMAAVQAQMSAMGMGGMGGMMGGGGMSSMNYSAEQMPHMYLMLGQNHGRQEITSSQALIGQSKYKGGMGAGGMALRSIATEGLSFAAMGAGPAGMMAMSAFSMASGFMPGMRPGAPTMTYVWGLSGRKSARELENTNPMFELNYGDIPGVDPDAYEPVVVQLFQTKDNYRLVGATQVKMNSKNMMAGTGPEGGKWVSEERWPSHADKEERGFYILHVDSPLDPGEYAIVLRPVKGYKVTPSAFGGGAQVFYSVWDFSVPGTPVDGKKKKKKH